jgi:rubredoxin
MANRRRAAMLPVCRNLLKAESQQGPPPETSSIDKQSTWLCPLCGGPMVVIERLTAQRIQLESLKGQYVDTS